MALSANLSIDGTGKKRKTASYKLACLSESSTPHSSLPVHLHYICMLSGLSIFHGWIADLLQPAYLLVNCWWLCLPLLWLRDYHLAAPQLCHYVPTASTTAALQPICVISRICLSSPPLPSSSLLFSLLLSTSLLLSSPLLSCPPLLLSPLLLSSPLLFSPLLLPLQAFHCLHEIKFTNCI